MRRSKLLVFISIITIFALMLTACSSTNTNQTSANEVKEEVSEIAEQTNNGPKTVEITDAYGTVVVPINPKNVVSLDNRTFETLAAWGIKLAAAPKDVMPDDLPYVTDESILNIGNHREPNLEVIAAVEPELVIIGQRFANYYEDIKALVPNAAVIDLNFDVSETAETPGENLVNGFKNTTLALGKIFNKNEEAQALIDEFLNAIEKAKAAYNGTDRVMSVIVSGGNIGFAAPSTGRVWGPLYEIFGWVPALDIDNATSDHQGDEVSVEAIAQSNPDWIFVLDRDAAVSSTTDAVPAKDVIENSPALQNTKAVKEGKIVYAPADTYANESIQTFIEIFNTIADVLSK